MNLTRRLAATALLALLLLPNAAYARDNDRDDCKGAAMQDDDCRDGKREKPRFQTKFFSG